MTAAGRTTADKYTDADKAAIRRLANAGASYNAVFLQVGKVS
jgi:hypothetical protein